jgi:energy-converting hydrogenase Eha subunit C
MIISITIAFRSEPANIEVAPAESWGGIIEKIAAPVYTDVVCAAACASIAEPFGTSESTSDIPM